MCRPSVWLLICEQSADTVKAIEVHGLSAMLVFTVTMGFTAFLMAWMTLVFTVRGWAVRRELPPALAAELAT